MCWGRSWSCPTPSCKTSGLHCAPGFQDIHSVWLLREATGCSSALTLRAFLPFSRFSSCCQSLTAGHTLSHKQSRKHSKMPPVPRAFSPFPLQWTRRHSQTPESAHRGSNGRHAQESTTALGPKCPLRLPRMRHRELNPAEGGSCCSSSLPL